MPTSTASSLSSAVAANDPLPISAQGLSASGVVYLPSMWRAVFGNCPYSWSVMFSLSVPGLLAIVLWFSCLSDLCRVSFAEVLTSTAPRLCFSLSLPISALSLPAAEGVTCRQSGWHFRVIAPNLALRSNHSWEFPKKPNHRNFGSGTQSKG